jgi:integrase
MTKQRGHGEGSIYQRKDGRWAASLTLEGSKRKTFYGKTRKEAYEKLKKAQHEHQHGLLSTGPKQTIKQYLEYWLEEVHKSTVKPATYIKYRSLLDRHVLPHLGYLQLQKLGQEHVQSLYSLKQKEGLSAKTIRLVHGILHKALDDAVRWGRLNRNVCDLVSQPRPVRYEIQPLTAAQVQKLLECAKGQQRLDGILTVALATGARQGEILALRWQDVDLEQRTLQIRRTVARLQRFGYVETEPKTLKGIRQIVLPEIAIDVLRRQRIYQNEARLKAGINWQDRDLVFSNKYGGYLDASKILLKFKAILKMAGLPDIRFHDLRHTAATILLEKNVHPKVVQERLGHSRISMTMDTYSHVLPSLQQEATDKLNDVFKEKGGPFA